MKQRTRVMSPSTDLMSLNMENSKKNDDMNEQVQLYRVKPQEHFIEAQVLENDTLQAIALRFHCSISELKRINQIHKDNEIFARRTVKIPITPYSVLTEMVPIHEDASTSKIIPEKSTNSAKDDFEINCNEVVMNSSLAPSIVPYMDNETFEPDSEDTTLLPKTKEPVETVVVKQLTSQGADFGIKWYHLVFCLLFLGVIIPIVYVMFYLDKHEHSDVAPLSPS